MSPSTRPLQIILAAALGFAGELGCAQPSDQPPGQVYRIVGPDGRVTFSDRPPTDAGMRASIVNRQAASGALVMPPPITAITPWTSLSADARRGIVPPIPLGETTASPSVVTFALADALSAVLARVELVEVMRSTCVRTAPSASSAYSDAAQRWRERNAVVVAQTDKVVQSAFDVAQRSKLLATAHTRVSAVMLALASAAPAAKIQWCEASADTLAHGALDLQGTQGPGALVMAFVPRAQ